jgi:hypothetical protein
MLATASTFCKPVDGGGWRSLQGLWLRHPFYMIPIRFYPGTHGNYVEFVLNKAIHGDKIHKINPLGSIGTSHAQRSDTNYRLHKTFNQVPWVRQAVITKDQPVIKIDFDSSDDIFIIQLNLKRSEDLDIDVDTLEHMTYQKLFGKYGPYGKKYHGPDKIIDDINKFTDLSPYYNIKDESWPAISSVDDFYNLPKHILDECINVFGYQPIQITESRPDAPRWVLRSLFKSWFYDQLNRPSSTMVDLDQYNNVYKLQLRNLYGVDSFKQEIVNIGKFFNIDTNLNNFSSQVHQQFIDMVPYKESKFNCERIVNSIDKCDHFQINLNVVEEGYVNYCLEQKFNIIMPEETKHYFKDTTELSTFVKQFL